MLGFVTEKIVSEKQPGNFDLGHPVSQNCPYFRGWVFRTNSPSVLVLKVDVDDKYDDITYLRNASFSPLCCRMCDVERKYVVRTPPI